MPIHLDDVDIVPEVDGLNSALIVACNMCAGASFAMKDNKPFLQPFRSLLISPPLERHIKYLHTQLRAKGLKTEWFRSGIIQQFFLCLWSKRQRSKFQKYVKEYEAVIVLGCDSAFRTIRDSAQGVDCKIIEGTKVAGIMNTKPKLHFPCNIYFEESKIVPACDRHCERFTHESQKEDEKGKE